MATGVYLHGEAISQACLTGQGCTAAAACSAGGAATAALVTVTNEPQLAFIALYWTVAKCGTQIQKIQHSLNKKTNNDNQKRIYSFYTSEAGKIDQKINNRKQYSQMDKL